MGESSESDYLTASATETEHLSAPSSFFSALSESATETEHATASSSSFFSALSESMLVRTESGDRTSTPVQQEQIEHFMCDWSHLADLDSDDEGVVAEIDNLEVFEILQSHSTWGRFFKTFGYETEIYPSSGELVVGEKFAEGGQAEIFHAHATWSIPADDAEDEDEWVLKVFKKGSFLRRLQSQWPHGMFQNYVENWEMWDSTAGTFIPKYTCDIRCGILLEDGRFAFLMQREQGDLRSLIDQKMLTTGQRNGPFSKRFAEEVMYFVANGMNWLHSCNIVHRDLKASNVLLTMDEKSWECFVADFECSIGVVGTGFFRAPEILQACKDKVLSRGPEIFTKAADVYSYGMTCYEVLTGKFPFEGRRWTDYDVVLNGQRPEVPKYVEDWTRDLLRKCWQSNPEDRPSFGDILNILRANSGASRDLELRLQQNPPGLVALLEQ